MEIFTLKKLPFKILTTNIKYLEINLTKDL